VAGRYVVEAADEIERQLVRKVTLTVPEWVPSSLLVPVVSTFRSNPVGHFLPHTGVLLGVVAEVPDVVHRTAVIVEQSVERLHAVGVDENHVTYFYPRDSVVERRRPFHSPPSRTGLLGAKLMRQMTASSI
jgi:hypothetical protein